MNESTYWVDRDEMWPVYTFRTTEHDWRDKYDLPTDLVEEYQRLMKRIEEISDQLFAHAQATGQAHKGATAL